MPTNKNGRFARSDDLLACRGRERFAGTCSDAGAGGCATAKQISPPPAAPAVDRTPVAQALSLAPLHKPAASRKENFGGVAMPVDMEQPIYEPSVLNSNYGLDSVSSGVISAYLGVRGGAAGDGASGSRLREHAGLADASGAGGGKARMPGWGTDEGRVSKR